jgi:hypothetical protein
LDRKCLKINAREEGGNQWKNMDVSSPGFDLFLVSPKNHFMASVHRRPASKFWHAFFRDSEGRLIDKSTRLRDRKQAQRVADTLEMAPQRMKSAQHLRAAFAQIFQDTMSIATSRPYADQWLETKKPEIARATFQSYSITNLRILGFSRAEGKSRLKRSSKGRFDRFSQFPARKTLKHLDQPVHLGFAHAVH